MLEAVRICRCCGKSFRPEVGRQVFCSEECRKKSTNTRRNVRRRSKTAAAIEASNQEQLSGKAHLSISEAAIFMGVSRPTIYAKIKLGELHPIRFSSHTIRIPMDELLASRPQPLSEELDYSALITLEEAMKKYQVSKSTIYEKLSRKGIKSKRVGFVTYLPKNELDAIFRPEFHPDESEWIAAEKLAEQQGLSRKYVNDFAAKHNVTRRKVGIKLYLNIKEWNEARFFRGDSEDYVNAKQAQRLFHVGGERFYATVNSSNIRRYRCGIEVFFDKKDLAKLFENKEPEIPAEIRKNYMRSCDALKHYHIGQKRFSEETQAAGVPKVKTAGNYVWYLKSELDRLFKKLI